MGRNLTDDEMRQHQIAEGSIERPPIREKILFLIKSAVVLVVLLFIGKIAPVLPPEGIAILWAVLSAASAIGIAYPWVVSKTHEQVKYEDGAWLGRLNAGRFLTILLSFVLAAVFSAGLISESPKWEAAEWCVVVIAIPLYLLIGIMVRKYLAGQFRPMFREPGIVTWTGGVTGVLLCALYFLLLFLQPESAANSAVNVFLSAEQPFANSSSTLMVETGKLTALIDGLSLFGIAKAAEASMGWALAWRVASCAASFFGITSLLGLCSLKSGELGRVYQALDKIEPVDKTRTLIRRYVVYAVVLPLCLVGLFLFIDQNVAKIAGTEEYTYAEQVIRSQVNLAVYTLDGKRYNKQMVGGLLEEAQSKSESLSEEARATLVPLINASYDARLANVDSYLDWYYSLPADYERLANVVAGSAESYASDQFSAKIEEGIDDTRLATELQNYSQQAEALKEEFMSQLDNCEIQGVPDWLVTEEEPLGTDFLDTSLEPTDKLLSATERFGISGAGGIAAGVVAENVATKALSKPFFGKIVSKIISVLGTRAAGAVIGGTAGSLAGPVGTVVGVVTGTAAGVGIDYGLLALDEIQNRDSYRQEIVDAIEESRAEALAMVQ